MVFSGKIKKISGDIPLALAKGFVFLFLTTCIVFPLLCVIITPSPGEFLKVIKSSLWKTAAIHTLIETICSTTLSVLIGFIYAYAVVRGNIPFKNFFSVVPLIHLITPPFVGGLSFILLLGRNGFITSTVLGLDVSLYGFPGLLIAQTLCFFPMAYMICVQTLSGINPSVENAAKALGAGNGKIFFTVTLPLAMPGILSAFLFIAVSVMSDFGNPMIVAGRYKVLAVEIYTQLTGWINRGTSAVLGLLLVIPSVILFIAQNKISRKQMVKTATIGGKGQNSSPVKATPLARFFLTAFCSLITVIVTAQFVAIIAGSFQKIWGVDTTFTLNHIKKLTKYNREIKNSLIFALGGAFFGTFFAAMSSYFVFRTNSRLKHYFDIISQLPSAIPGTLFGLAFSLASAKLNFHNSPFLIVTAITVGFMPFSYRIISSTFGQIKTTLDDGARSLGASPLKVFWSILMPISGGAFFKSFIYDFVRGVGTMSAVIFLVSFKTPLASIKILNLAEQGFWGDAAALALLLTLITFIIMGLGQLVTIFLKRRKHFA